MMKKAMPETLPSSACAWGDGLHDPMPHWANGFQRKNTGPLTL
jgi:hypothetical protein